jgi:glycosyltransferase involved in cell wall biosynthesis
MKKLNLACPINSTGYGVASLNILKNLSEDYDISFLPIGQPVVQTKKDYEELSTLLEKFSDIEDIDMNSPYLKIWHQFDLGNHFGRGDYFAFPFFELDTFDKAEKKHLSVPDQIFATSQWSKDVLIDNGVTCPVNIVPLGVDREIFDYKKPKTIHDDKYVFLTIGKWEVRKSHDLLPILFKKAFRSEKDVELWILASESTNSYSNEEDLKEWKELYNLSNIKIIPGVKSHHDVADVIANSDCGIYISRAEGWNLELLETMAMNKPVIATNYSSHTEFCNKDNSFLVDITETEKAEDGKAFRGQGNWAKIGSQQQDQIISYMRHLYSNRINTNPAGLKTAEVYSWKNSADKISGCIK